MARSGGTTARDQGHPWFAAVYDLLNRGLERGLLRRLRPSVVGEARGRVLEIGVGTGASFPYYRRAAVERLVATDPDPHMLRRAERRAQQLDLPVALQQAPAEALPFADASFDTVVSTLVLCTVADPALALAEARRVLKPGGTLRFIEHVRAEGRLGRLQDLATPLWRRAAAGCHPNRRTARSIEAAGFDIAKVGVERITGGVPLIVGTARREPTGDATPIAATEPRPARGDAP